MQSACAVLSPVASPAVQYFPHYLIKGKIFEKKKTLLNIKIIILVFPITYV